MELPDVLVESYTQYQDIVDQDDMEFMPDVRGMYVMDALPLLENMGLQVQVKGVGKVKKQSIPKGQKIEKNKKVILELS